jgi:phosphate transport system permease protein
MNFIRKIIERITESILTISGWIASITILLIVIFLFKEGSGLFNSNIVEVGYVLCLNANNPVDKLNAKQIKMIFDSEITDWNQVGGNNNEIMLFRLDDIFNYYDDEELGENYELLPEKLGEIIADNPNIILFTPCEYYRGDENHKEKYKNIILLKDNKNVKLLHTDNHTLNEFMTGSEWIPTATPAPLFGVLPLITGTLLVSFFAILLALPFGLGVAVYLSEIASKQIYRILKPMIELLAGIPSVVYGFFGLVVVVPFVQQTFNLPVGETALAGSIVLAIMALPTIITIAEDSMRMTPRSIREASLALGGTHWQTIYRVVIPNASSGIMAAVILGIGRAIGETMAVLMVTGNAALITASLFSPVRTIPATIAAELGEAPTGGSHYQALFVLGCILFIITMIGSIAAEIIAKKRK